jgi:L-threonylcarbamoyladenylate synthase
VVVLRVRVDPLRAPEDQLLAAVSAIQGGGVVAFPTDTLYGLGADPRSSTAVRRIFQLKGRPHDQPIPLIADSLSQVEGHAGRLTPLARRLALQCWPGPLTLVIAASPDLCPDVTGGTGTVAVRVPDHPVARALARGVGHPVTSTSANRSGSPPSSSAEEVAVGLGDLIDVLVDAGPSPGGLPSTIVDVTGTEPVLVRAGAVHWERVLKFLR